MVKPAMLGDWKRVSAPMLAAAIATAPAAAQTAPPRKEVRQACGADMKALCAGVVPGGGRIKQCMIEKFDQLSDDCKSAVKDARAASTRK